MHWLKKKLNLLKINSTSHRINIPKELWSKCLKCNKYLFINDLKKNLYVCPKCDYHNRITARKRIEIFLDPDSQIEIGADLKPVDKLHFKDSKSYKDRLNLAQKTTKENDALIVIQGYLNSKSVVICAFEFFFIGGSMGAVVGEKFVQAVNYAMSNHYPLICFSCSGGVRMQESFLGLMQMAKTSAALAKLSKLAIPYISVMIDPCTGGVSASLANLGDINIAEPKALIGFAGPRVIQQTVRQTLPTGFQRSEFLLEHGFIDMIVDRRNMRNTISRLLDKLMK